MTAVKLAFKEGFSYGPFGGKVERKGIWNEKKEGKYKQTHQHIKSKNMEVENWDGRTKESTSKKKREEYR